MKKRNVNGKISLNKETITKLNGQESNSIQGGITGYPCLISAMMPGICNPGSFAAPTCKGTCTAGCVGSDFC